MDCEYTNHKLHELVNAAMAAEKARLLPEARAAEAAVRKYIRDAPPLLLARQAGRRGKVLRKMCDIAPHQRLWARTVYAVRSGMPSVPYAAVCASGCPGSHYCVYVVVTPEHPWFEGQSLPLQGYGDEDCNRFSHRGLEWTHVSGVFDGGQERIPHALVIGGDTGLSAERAMRRFGLSHFAHAKREMNILLLSAVAAAVL